MGIDLVLLLASAVSLVFVFVGIYRGNVPMMLLAAKLVSVFAILAVGARYA